MDAGRLVVLCGAGLSMAPPSNLPSARQVAEMCFDAYQLRVDPHIDPSLRQDLGALAEYFASLNTLKVQFIDNLVPWREFVRPPNPGHAAIADFLITKAAVAGLSSNYDELIEQRAKSYGADFRGSLDGDEATACSHTQAPFLKFHGCSNRDRGSTVWAQSQLSDPIISDRITRSRVWMEANLRHKDLLVVGFWSDWDYLNQIIGGALQGIDPLSITVFDLSGSAALEQKAPDLWALAHRPLVTFSHVQESGADALDEVRRAFSENYLRQVIAAGRAAFEEMAGIACDPAWLNVAAMDGESFYDWRRDAEGVPNSCPATTKRPRDCDVLGCFHLLLRRAGAVQQPQGYTLHGRSIRVINGAGCVLNSLAARFIEAPAASSADVFVAVGATDLGLPGHVVRPGTVGSIMRPAAGGQWLTFEQAQMELGV
ncbi:MAG: SIR2 family protein [Proteobacteria bacterium]|nr:MAG: SIR2 family protein [Pseudomonadota bacterium]